MTRLASICLYCGSSNAAAPAYLDLARRFGKATAARGLRLVYGGGGIGLMGQAAKAAHGAGGQVLGVMPKFLARREVVYNDVPHIMVDTMHERKARMFEESDAFVALPGGIGTLEELLEVATWSKLGIHAKPCGVVNTCGYYDALGAMLDAAVEEGFMAPEYRGIIVFDAVPARLLNRL
jgi:hypothetical protein